MENKENTLSSKINELEKSWSWLLAPDYKDVHYKVMDDVRKLNKEFIKKLKDEIFKDLTAGQTIGFWCAHTIQKIDKLAGKELLE